MIDRGGGVTASLQLAAARRGDLEAFVAVLKGHDRQLRAIAWRTPGVWYSIRWKPSAATTYRYHVYANDTVGNRQSRIGSAKVSVR